MNIYSPENIARSRARAAQIREQLDNGDLPDPDGMWAQAALDIEQYATEREQTVALQPA